MTEISAAPAAPVRPLRADARRNYDRILAAAGAEVARSGANASLEEIARQAGVGSATLHRHFPTRQALLEEVFHDRVEALCAQARELAASDDPGEALVTWLRAVAVYGATTRGLAASLMMGPPHPPSGAGCGSMLLDAGGELLRRAQGAGAVRPETTMVDLLTLVNAVSLVTEGVADAADEAVRLVSLAIDGVRPLPVSGPAA
ncbi:TetR/AcrR family transcriptional regulator [Promicromonospora kroppenstedtii]|uniref:TetR/AcrR family transcriptional regulator n=1 Tax=Promicromonospora kroppenstedtii TaxID=440482 RepID=UPI0004BC5043|nr:TetR/AcrR family transcriptional regulator [Promicromonospora kroppenstedtii]